MTNRWVRLHRSALHNPKIVSLNDRQHRTWISCLLIADDTGKLPALRDIACHLRATPTETEQEVCELVEACLIDVNAPGTPTREFRMHDWDLHQFLSDSSADRTKKWRAGKKAKNQSKPRKNRNNKGGKCSDGRVTSHSQPRNVGVTRPEAEPETETETEKPSFVFPERFAKRGPGVSPGLQKKAEGLGIPVAELVRRATAPGVKKPDAFFRHLAIAHLQKLLPSADSRMLAAALTHGGGAALGSVYQLLLEEPSNSQCGSMA